MPQDPDLYGQRPAKKQKKEIPLSSSLEFTSQLSSLLSAPTTSSSTRASASSGRARPSKTAKDDIFNVKARRKAAAASSSSSSSGPKVGPPNDGASSDRQRHKIRLKDVNGTEEEKNDLARTRRKMDEKARLYAAMKRGDYIAKDNEAAPLVDFDRKWAEKHPEGDGNGDGTHYPGSGADSSSSSGDDDDDDDDADELVEYKDEFGRTRRGTRAEVARLQRRTQRGALGAAELERMAARPTRVPERLIHGDAIQSAAFSLEDDNREKMERLAARRDRSPTPPEDMHFDGAAEIRTKGVGFYQFSRDAAGRGREMEALARERENTESVRRDREAGRERRRAEIEERRRRIGRARAERMADSFLDGLAGEMGGGKGEGKGEEEAGQADKGASVARAAEEAQVKKEEAETSP